MRLGNLLDDIMLAVIAWFLTDCVKKACERRAEKKED